jgi:hypothetical protein
LEGKTYLFDGPGRFPRGAHHLARVFTVTLALLVIVRVQAPARKTKSGRPLRPQDGEFGD